MARKPPVPERLRRQVQERAQGRCEYCLIHENDMYYPHEPDHVIAEKHGGATSLENLAWSCFYCNRFIRIGSCLRRSRFGEGSTPLSSARTKVESSFSS